MADYILTRDAEDDIDGIGLYSFKNRGLNRVESYLKNLDACFESLRGCHRLDRTRDDIKPGLLSRSCQKHVIRCGRTRGYFENSGTVDGRL